MPSRGPAAIIGTVHGSHGRGPDLRLRPLGPQDRELSAQVGQPEVAGEWDSFDESAEDMLPSARFGGATLVIELADGTAAGVVSYIRVPYADQGVFAIPDGVSDERALFASDAAPTGWTGAP